MKFFKSLFYKDSSPSNPQLEKAMHAVALADNATTRAALYKRLLQSTLIVPGSVTGGVEQGSGKRVADSDTRFSFRTVEHPPGNIILPVFTDLQALKDWAEGEVPWVGLASRDLFGAIVATNINEVRVNAFRPEGKIKKAGGVITRMEFQALAQGLIPQPKDSSGNLLAMTMGRDKFLIGPPAERPPAELQSKLATLFQETREIEAAYLFRMTQSNLSNTVIGLRFAIEPAEARMREIMTAIGERVRSSMPPGRFIDFMSLRNDRLGQQVERFGECIFRAQRTPG